MRIASDQLDDAEGQSVETCRLSRATTHLIRIRDAARITGLPQSLIRKSFMREEKRPRNIPDPPPHKRIGRAIYIVSDDLSDWVQNLNTPPGMLGPKSIRRRGRPTVVERIARRSRRAI